MAFDVGFALCIQRAVFLQTRFGDAVLHGFDWLLKGICRRQTPLCKKNDCYELGTDCTDQSPRADQCKTAEYVYPHKKFRQRKVRFHQTVPLQSSERSYPAILREQELPNNHGPTTVLKELGRD